MKDRESLGQGQWEMLRYITDHAPVTVAEAAEEFGKTHGLARTTVLTVMERLRAKGYVTRAKQSGIYAYSPAVTKSQLLRDAVAQFVQNTMGGSFAPFLAYLAQETSVSDEELRELKRLVQELEAGQGNDTNRKTTPEEAKDV
jgi:predicted transcriptional regulator